MLGSLTRWDDVAVYALCAWVGVANDMQTFWVVWFVGTVAVTAEAFWRVWQEHRDDFT